MNFKTPQGMNRRHFMRHLAGASEKGQNSPKTVLTRGFNKSS